MSEIKDTLFGNYAFLSRYGKLSMSESRGMTLSEHRLMMEKLSDLIANENGKRGPSEEYD